MLDRYMQIYLIYNLEYEIKAYAEDFLQGFEKTNVDVILQLNHSHKLTDHLKLSFFVQ